MTTNKEALQKIFEAALKEPETQYTSATKTRSRTPVESYPKTRSYGEPAAVATAQRAIEPVSKEVTTPDTPTKKAIQVEPAKTAATATDSAVNHDAASAELAGILDKKMSKEANRRKMKFVMMVILVLGGTGGGAAWFLQSSERIDSVKSAITEVQSTTDIEGITGQYDKSLDKVAVRGSQLDEATEAMGASTELKAGEDGYMETEMKGMMGGEGKTAGERARGMEKSFVDRKK